MTVAYLHGSGGAERQICMLSNALSERGHDVTLVALAECNKCFELSSSVKLIDLSYIEQKKGLSIINRFLAYRKLMLALKPDVSIHFFFQSAYFSAILPKSKIGKIIYSERGDPYDSEFDGLLGIVRYFADKVIDGFVFQSNGAKNYFDEKIKNRCIVIPNCVSITDFDSYDTKQEREKIIVNVGRLHPQKNQKLLIEAFAKIAQDFPEYRLEIYGNGELSLELEKQIEANMLMGRVLLKKPTKQIYQVLNNATLFVLSSNFEGMPNALLEAMCLGVPCISTDCRPGGARMIINDGVDGFIVPVNDSNSLAQKIALLLSDEKLRNEFSSQALLNRKRFSSSNTFEKWEMYIKKIVGQ